MNREFKEEDRYLKAEKRVTELKGWYIHIIVSVLLIPFLILINHLTYQYTQFTWYWFPVGGIIVSLIIHTLTVFKIGTEWEERKIKEFMDKDDF